MTDKNQRGVRPQDHRAMADEARQIAATRRAADEVSFAARIEATGVPGQIDPITGLDWMGTGLSSAQVEILRAEFMADCDVIVVWETTQKDEALVRVPLTWDRDGEWWALINPDGRSMQSGDWPYKKSQKEAIKDMVSYWGSQFDAGSLTVEVTRTIGGERIEGTATVKIYKHRD